MGVLGLLPKPSEYFLFFIVCWFF